MQLFILLLTIIKCSAEAELRKVPFEDEIKLCESSIEYLDKKNKVYEAFMQLSQRTIPTAASSSSVSESALKSDGKVFKVMKREEPESKLFKVQEKKNKKKKSAMALGQPASANGVATGGTSDDSIVHDEMQAGIFTFLGVEAPSKIGEIGATVAALNTKKEYYRGQERNAPGVTTYAAFLKAQEKLAAKEAAKVQDSLVSEEPDVAPVKSKSRKEIVFTVDELTSVDLFPSLGLGETPESELTVA